MSQYAAPGTPASGLPYQVTGAPAPYPQAAPPRPAWMSARSTLEWVASGVAGFGLLIAVISLVLPWEVHVSHGEYGYTLYTSAQGSGGLSYTGGLMLLVSALIALHFTPRRFNLPLRVFSGVLALLLIGLLAGVSIATALEDGSGRNEDHVSWGLILAFVAVIVFGIAAGLSQPAPAAPEAVAMQPAPEGYGNGVLQPGEAYPYQGGSQHPHG
ncbi:MAG: hypothetical protein ACRDTM_05710 [Micromonosporaceae bacterium]